MSKKIYNKLVRDKIPEIIINSGKKPTYTRIESDINFYRALRLKLNEEVRELLDANTSLDILEEVADIQEVLFAILKLEGYTLDDLKDVFLKKKAERGSFNNRLFLLDIE